MVGRKGQIIRDYITIVSGLPRSGTSMVMGMLEAGGIEPVTDRVREADADNPRGYYEHERVKKLAEDATWMNEVGGRVVKVISQLLKKLPQQHYYRVVFMQRNLDEILASQRQMLRHRKLANDGIEDDTLRNLFANHLDEIRIWLAHQDHFDVHYANFEELVREPALGVGAMDRFLGGGLDLPAMAAVVDKTLYRQRK